jgi:replicative DNA helicase Mcm
LTVTVSRGFLDPVSIQKRFLSFLTDFRLGQDEVYRRKIIEMAANKERAMVVDFEHLIEHDHDLAKTVQSRPDAAMPALKKALLERLQVLDPEYASEVKDTASRNQELKGDVKSFNEAASLIPLNVRFRLPQGSSVRLRELGAQHVDTLIQIEAVALRVAVSKPYLVIPVYKCVKCDNVQPGVVGLTEVFAPLKCTNVLEDQQRCGGPMVLDAASSYSINHQRLLLQERQEELRGGVLPRGVQALATDDLVDKVKPGSRIRVTGIFRAYQPPRAQGERALETFIEINHFEAAEKEFESVELSPKDLEEIKRMSSDPWLKEKLVDSLAPGIYGLADIKEAILLALVGAPTVPLPDNTRVRGDSHLLILGDPGTGKSQLLQTVSRLVPRGIYTSGKGSSGVGLTAAVVRDSRGEFMLEAGAMVLADGGVTLLDEIDKMDNNDRSAIHEALEQQSYHPSVEVLFADGSRRRIGEFVDQVFERHPSQKIRGVDCEILPLQEEALVYSVDPTDWRVSKVPVHRVSRHVAPDRFVRIRFSNGRSVVVTPEHPVFVNRGGALRTVEAACVRVGDRVPAPRLVPNSSAPVVLTQPCEPPGSPRRGFSPPQTLTDGLSWVLGCLAAAGRLYSHVNHDEERVSVCELRFSAEDPVVPQEARRLMLEEFGVEPVVSATRGEAVVQRYLSEPLCSWLTHNFPELVFPLSSRRAPSKIVGASRVTVRRFVSAFFAVKGAGDARSVWCTTASEGLAEDLQDMLLKLGVFSRLARRGRAFRVVVEEEDLNQFLDEVRSKSLLRERGVTNAPRAAGSLEPKGAVDPVSARISLCGAGSSRLEAPLSPRYLSVESVETLANAGAFKTRWVYDVTVEPHHNFVSKGVVLHNTVTITKAGIHATLNARCGVIAAGNPTFGKYLRDRSVADNINLPPTILSRFDLIFIVEDKPDERRDKEMAEFVLKVRGQGQINIPFSGDTIRKYIAYARHNVFPELSPEAAERLNSFYSEMRRKSESPDSPVVITTRQLEGLVRLTKAHARLRLSKVASAADAEAAIRLYNVFLEGIGIYTATGEKADLNTIIVGKTSEELGVMARIDKLFIGMLAQAGPDGVLEADFKQRCLDEGFTQKDVEKFLKLKRADGVIIEPKPGRIGRVRV